MFTLDQVVPWGRSFDEYRRMFALSEQELSLKILGCGDGPASFNAEATRRGARVISFDPVYRFEAHEIRRRVAETRGVVLDQTRKNASQFVWTIIRSIDELETVRMTAMDKFFDDLPRGKAEGRYLDAELPKLPFEATSFDLALCSHLLFLYSEQLDFEFHREAVAELCRVAREVRIFPLLTLGGERSKHLDPIVDGLLNAGLEASVNQVPYEFQRGGNEMLRIRSAPREPREPHHREPSERIEDRFVRSRT